MIASCMFPLITEVLEQPLAVSPFVHVAVRSVIEWTPSWTFFVFFVIFPTLLEALTSQTEAPIAVFRSPLSQL